MKKYNTILIDPPWPERGGGKIKRGADRHYQLLSVEDIPKVIQYECLLYRPADNAHLYFWVTDNYLPEGIGIMKDIGFRYIRTLPWIKLKNEAFDPMNTFNIAMMAELTPAQFFDNFLKIGLGKYFRSCSELLLFGVRGKGMDQEVFTDRKDLNNIIIGPRGSTARIRILPTRRSRPCRKDRISKFLPGRGGLDGTLGETK
jgi:N6-adenosine-specific RNA methylase IME4